MNDETNHTSIQQLYGLFEDDCVSRWWEAKWKSEREKKELSTEAMAISMAY